jgi:hypothetical protein
MTDDPTAVPPGDMDYVLERMPLDALTADTRDRPHSSRGGSQLDPSLRKGG